MTVLPSLTPKAGGPGVLRAILGQERRNRDLLMALSGDLPGHRSYSGLETSRKTGTNRGGWVYNCGHRKANWKFQGDRHDRKGFHNRRNYRTRSGHSTHGEGPGQWMQ